MLCSCGLRIEPTHPASSGNTYCTVLRSPATTDRACYHYQKLGVDEVLLHLGIAPSLQFGRHSVWRLVLGAVHPIVLVTTAEHCAAFDEKLN